MKYCTNEQGRRTCNGVGGFSCMGASVVVKCNLVVFVVAVGTLTLLVPSISVAFVDGFSSYQVRHPQKVTVSSSFSTVCGGAEVGNVGVDNFAWTKTTTVAEGMRKGRSLSRLNRLSFVSESKVLHGRSLKSSFTTTTRLFQSANGDIPPEMMITPENNSESQYTEPKVYPQRWVQLIYLSLLALLSDWICFSVAAAPSAYEAAYPGHSAASLIDIFLFTNVASCFLVTDVVAKVGLEKAVKGAAGLMAVGCLLRSGVEPIMNLFSGILQSGAAVGVGTAAAASSSSSAVAAAVAHTPAYPLLLAGTIAVGAAQPFFQCTPPLLSATWFASDERATSTAVALNFNQIGIATAFLVGGAMATAGPSGLANYFALITTACALVTAGTFVQFQNKPPSPPSTSEIEKLIRGEEEPPFFESVKGFFSRAGGGFGRALAAFICSISITNVVGAFIDEVLERGGIEGQTAIDLAGAGFELAILVGGIVIGGYVDRTKQYKSVTMACLVSTLFLLVPLGLTDHALGKEPILLLLSLLGLGMAVGPVQPINAELAVDVTYPGDETAVESVQQIGGNLVSALLVPLAEMAAKQDFEIFSTIRFLDSDIRGDVILMVCVAAVTLGYFSGFDSQLRRTIADCGDDGVCDLPQLNTAAISVRGLEGENGAGAFGLSEMNIANMSAEAKKPKGMTKEMEEELKKLGKQ